MKRGLVFGKFMPLHRGHELLIDTALSQVDDLTIVVYDSDPSGSYPAMGIEKRLGWLRQLYPDVESIVPVEDPERHNPEHDSPRYAAAYAAGLRFLDPFDIVFTSEPVYKAFAREMGARHVVVDAARELVPISGTRIRESVFEHRGWLNPVVYASLIQKVALVGTESTGKSTLARALAKEYQTLWVHEFGRELWVAQGGGGSFADHLRMARRQYQREQAAARHAREFLFCDTNAWTTLQWSLWSYGTADARLYDLVDRTMGEYLWVLCGREIPWQDDGWREMPGEKAARFHEQQIADLRRRDVGFLHVQGSVAERVRQVGEALRKGAGSRREYPDAEWAGPSRSSRSP
jgi:NadR type nicotinamide-nucleotide adenylyltransferase